MNELATFLKAQQLHENEHAKLGGIVENLASNGAPLSEESLGLARQLINTPYELAADRWAAFTQESPDLARWVLSIQDLPRTIAAHNVVGNAIQNGPLGAGWPAMADLGFRQPSIATTLAAGAVLANQEEASRAKTEEVTTFRAGRVALTRTTRYGVPHSTAPSGHSLGNFPPQHLSTQRGQDTGFHR